MIPDVKKPKLYERAWDRDKDKPTRRLFRRIIDHPGSVDELTERFAHALDVIADASEVDDYKSDLDRIIVLKYGILNLKLGMGEQSKVGYPSSEGYYAVGRELTGDESGCTAGQTLVGFGVYVSNNNVLRQFPGKLLRAATAEFMMKLIENGYQVRDVKAVACSQRKWLGKRI